MNYLQFSTAEGERVSLIYTQGVAFIIYHREEVQDAPVDEQYEDLLEKTREVWKKP